MPEPATTTPAAAEPEAKRQRRGAPVYQEKEIMTQWVWTSHANVPPELVPYYKDMASTRRRLNTEGAPTFYEVTFKMKAFLDENALQCSLS